MNIISSGFIHPVIGIITGLTLIFGCELVGRFFVKRFDQNFFFLNLSFGIITVSYVTYISVFLGIYKYLDFFISYSILCLGIYEIIYIIKKKNLNIKLNFYLYFVFFYLFILFILSISAPTMADALDYHLGVPNYINNHKQLPNPIFWPSSTLIGLGEIFNTLGLKVYSDIAGSLLQFIGLLSFLFYFHENILNKSKYILFSLFILGSPVLIFFISGAKHQLFPQLIMALILYFLVMTKKIELKLSFLIIFLICGVANFKLNFLITGFVLSILLLLKVKINYRFIFLCLVCVIIFFFPKAIFNFYNAEDFTYTNFFTLAPEYFLEGLKNFRETNFIFPIGLFIPISVGSITTILGFQFLIFFFIGSFYENYKKQIIQIIVVSIASGILLFIFAQKIGRIYHEILLYFSLIIIFTNKFKLHVNILKKFLLINIFPSILVSLFGFILLSSSLISNKKRQEVMRAHAAEFNGAEWINKNIHSGEVILTDLRSIAFLDSTPIIINNDFKNNQMFLDYIKNNIINYIVLKNFTSKENYFFKNCDIKIVKKSPEFLKETRNIFNQNQKYIIYILEFKNIKKSCL